MTTHYVPLPVISLPDRVKLTFKRANPGLVYLDDQATDIMLDLMEGNILVVDSREKVDNITRALQVSGNSEALVTHHANIIGVLSSRDIQGMKPLQIGQAHQLPREEITAELLMTPCENVLIFSYHDLVHARVGNVITSLLQHKKEYALVVETSCDLCSHLIRGLIVTAKVRAQLGKHPEELSCLLSFT